MSVKKMFAAFGLYVMVTLLLAGVVLPPVEPVNFDWLNHVGVVFMLTAISVVVVGIALCCVNALLTDEEIN